MVRFLWLPGLPILVLTDATPEALALSKACSGKGQAPGPSSNRMLSAGAAPVLHCHPLWGRLAGKEKAVPDVPDAGGKAVNPSG